jgi:Tol biopolymer transport system component
VTISPDGTRVVASQNDRRSGTGDLWLYDISRAEPTVRQLTHDTFSEQNVVWSPDGRSIAFRWDGGGPPDVYVMSTEGGPARVVHRTPDVDTPRAWLPGNRLLVTDPTARVVGLDGAVDDGVGSLPSGISSVSPDGRWAATVRNQTGRSEVYVQPFGREGVPVMASRSGGQAPVWAADSRSLHYRTDRSVYVVRMHPGPALDFDPPEHLFTLSREILAWDVMPKGDRFLVVQRPIDFLPVNVIVNWQALLR